ncbi:helix-turn-helix transcriptional regulator [Paludibacterium sp.]|uniref:helix-turn-helix domain-containing protein n=1 Tax=Paludibacterium sp. TaxID=1917523 RepID=UPI0025CF73C4|nr:helix-turn-helix transcriptional regulator [Paludibacterium sp.]MBV8647845.1 helix-turn-helix transcriptional regulator [Paludibacterium sp.]
MSIGRQIRAARGLLKWSSAILAEKAGLTRDTITKIEDDAVQPREGTLADIIRVFDENGVNFTDNSGVCLKPQGVEVLTGHDGLCRFFDHVYEHARKHGGTIVQYGLEEHFLSDIGGDYAKFHRKRMLELVEQRKDLKVLAIVCEGDDNIVCSDYNEYRWIPKGLFSPVLFYIFGECTAVMNFQTVPAPTIILMKFPTITNACRKQFEIFWGMSEEFGTSGNGSQHSEAKIKGQRIADQSVSEKKSRRV